MPRRSPRSLRGILSKPLVHFPGSTLLEYRGIRVYHAYRSQEYAEPYQFQYSLSPDEEATGWQFDVRDLAGGIEPVDPIALIRAILDRCLNEGMLFPYAYEPGPLPDQAENVSPSHVPDDWDLLDLLLALRQRTKALAEPLTEAHIAGVTKLLQVLTKMDPSRQATLEQWLREGHA